MPKTSGLKYGKGSAVRTDERTKIAVSLLAAQLTLESGESISVNMAVWTAIEKAFPDIAAKAIEFYEKKNPTKRVKKRGNK